MTTNAPDRIDAIDFWRGFALLTIFIDHAPENVIQYVTQGELRLFRCRRGVRVPLRRVSGARVRNALLPRPGRRSGRCSGAGREGNVARALEAAHQAPTSA